MNKKSDLVICCKCNWAHFQVSLEYAKKWRDDWVVYWNTLDDKGKDAFGVRSGPPTIEYAYLNCFSCRGSYKNMREALDSEIPFGSTIQPILDRNEDV